MVFRLQWVLVLLAVALLTITAPTGVSHAVPVLDQVFDPANPTGSGISPLVQKAQTFTVGLAGTLARVDVLISQNPPPDAVLPLLFDVRATNASGAPLENDSATLAAVSIPAASVPATGGFFSVDVSGFGIKVTPGEVLAIVLREAGPTQDVDYLWFGSRSNLYPAGAAYFRNTTAGFPTWTLFPPVDGSQDLVFDLGFKTFVTVPAPSAGVLFGLGIGALAGVRWRRHRRL